MNTRNILHENLKHYRTQKQLSQTDVANHLSVSRQAISNWESGRSYPDLDNIILLCNLYGITTDELLRNNTKQKVEGKDATPQSTSEPQQEFKILGKSTQIILEILCLAVILVLASQFAVLGMLVPILVVIWLKKSKRNYKIVYILCLVIFLIGMRNSYVIVEHALNLGKAHIESV